ncbi:MAG: magnesium chelatase [Desulfuromonas sp.]|nr:MAG: magnesium chelatase [Desulfuromonas sp.]
MQKTNYPFSAILGQDDMKTALLLCAVDPAIGGVLIRGDKGTGKTTAVRGLTSLLPDLSVVEGCPYNCPPDQPDVMHDGCRQKFERGEELKTTRRPTPLVDLPLAASEDRVVGTLNLESALRDGERRFEPGLLATANRGILYVDEVNLLGDHLIDLLLDVAASGVNVVERESLQVRHPARFLLIGTMNPEEGELRPQFLDRFGLCVSVEGVNDLQQRSEIIRRHLSFETSPVQFGHAWAESQVMLSRQLLESTDRLPHVQVPEDILERAALISLRAKTAGHRADLTMIRAARALCALLDRPVVGSEELLEAARFVLPHRMGDATFVAPSELGPRLQELLKEQVVTSSSEKSEPGLEDFGFLADNMQVPGATAAGGNMLFDFLKKKVGRRL